MSYELYEQVYDGEWFNIKIRGHKERCCDCGCVHWVDSRIVKVDGQRGIQQRATRDAQLTYAARRRMGVIVVRTK